MNELLLQGEARNSKECSKWRQIVYFAPYATAVIKWYVGENYGVFPEFYRLCRAKVKH